MIRELTVGDYKKIKDLVWQIHEIHYKNRPDIYTDKESFPIEYFQKIINDISSLCYLYEKDNQICGLLIATKKESRKIPIFKKRVTYYIEDIVVDLKYRKQGIGKELYYFLVEKAKKNKVDAIELNVWAFNEVAIRFYQSLGMSVKSMQFEKVLNDDKIDTKNIELKATKRVIK